ncbi:MAG: hypothetical protein JW748_12360 [Anaerolineales bacterium]|nr:hypothetical protein [Anaerolineales bacterium]
MTGISLLGIIFSGSSQSAQSSYSTISGSSSIGGVLTGLGAVVCLPVVYGVLGFITGIITAFFLNLALKYAGGLEIEADGFQLPAPLKDIPPKIEPLGPLPR